MSCPSPIGRDRRRHPRRLITLEAGFELGGDGLLFAGETLDVSLGGAKLTTTLPLVAQRCGLLVLRPRDGVPILAMAYVLQSTPLPQGTAVARLRFMAMSDSNWRRLVDRLASR